MLGLLVPWARVLASVAGVACIVAGSVNVVQGQNVHHYLSGSNWAASFVNAGNLVWLGVVLLLADAVISGAGAARAQAGGPAEVAGAGPERRARTGATTGHRRHRRLTRRAAQVRVARAPPPLRPAPRGRGGPWRPR